MSRTFPKLLIATEFSQNAPGGGPAIVRQMLKGWPAQKLGWWSCLPDQEAGEFKVHIHRVAYIPRKLYPHSRLVRPKVWLLRHLWSRWATKQLRVLIEQCQPDVIWAIPNLWSIPPLARALPEAGVAYHISIHDYPDTQQSEKRLGRRTSEYFLSLLQELYRHASTRDAIGDEMAADLEITTGRSVNQILRAGLELEDFAYLDCKRSSNSQVIKIAYVGTIIAEETLIRFTESLSRLRKRLSKPVEFHFFGSHAYRERSWFAPEWMIEHGNLNLEKLSAALRTCDWGFAPMELTDKNPRYNRFSIPTKLISYLAAGVAIISFGHKDSTIARLATKYSFGILLDDSDTEKLDLLLGEGLSEPNVWFRYGEEILRCARTEFDATLIRSQLQAALGVH
jgi:glycosyltransferase involved in cell wall biosynthesis